MPDNDDIPGPQPRPIRPDDLAPDEQAAPADPPIDPPAEDALAGTESEYEAIEELGRGGMGTVYKAYQKRLNRYVALKIMSPDTGEDHSFAERFQREAKTMARLDHPNIVTVYDFGETDEGMLFLTMEYVEGTTLRQIMRSEGLLDPMWVVGCAAQICDGLSYAHVHQTIHRDIKPGNILLSVEGRIKILDFGLAKLVGHAKTDVSLTATNVAMGTPDYIAPEQLEHSAKVDHRADIYSLGVMLYEMFTGKLPRGAFFAPSEVRPGLDPRIDELVLRCMQTKPAERFENVQEMIDLLNEIHADSLEAETAAPSLTQTARVPIPSGMMTRASSASTATNLTHTARQRVRTAVSKSLPAATRPQKAATKAASEIDTKNLTSRQQIIRLQEIQHKQTRKNRIILGAVSVVFAAVAIPLYLKYKPQETPLVALPENGIVDRRTGIDESVMDSADEKPAAVAAENSPPDRLASISGIPLLSSNVLAKHFPLDIEGEPGRVVAINRTANVPAGAGAGAVPEGLDNVVALELSAFDWSSGPNKPKGHCVALKADGTVVAWGVNSKGQTDVPENLSDAVAVSTAAEHCLALRRNGTVVAWGDNQSGQCNVPKGLDGVIAIDAGTDHSLALRADGSIVAWGKNADGECNVPPDVSDAIAIRAGQSFSLALQSDGQVVAWGRNKNGECAVPAGLAPVKSIDASGPHAWALLEDGTIVLWGKDPGAADAFREGKGFSAVVAGKGTAGAARLEDGSWVLSGPGIDKPSLEKQLENWSIVHVGQTHLVGILPGGAEAVTVDASPAKKPAADKTPEPDTPIDPAFVAAEAEFLAALETEVERPFEESMDKLIASYDGALDRESRTAKGEIAGWITAERDRLKRKELEIEPVGDGIPGILRDMQQTYIEKRAEVAEARRKDGIDRREEFDNKLNQIQIALTKADKLAEAKKFRDYRNALPELYSFELKEPDPRPIARFVRIELPGADRVLTLAEVEVFSGGVNIAPAGVASQSSTDHGGDAARAIDGNASGAWADNGQTHTAVESNPWWEIDLGKDQPIERIVIHNRQDGDELRDRLADFTLALLDAQKNIVDKRSGNPAQLEPLALAFAEGEFAPGDAVAVAGIDVSLPEGATGPITLSPAVPSGVLALENDKFKSPRFGQSIENSVGMILMGVQPGKFRMGNPGQRQREVTLTHGFWLGKYEVTRAQWIGLMGNEYISLHDSNLNPRGDDFPITHVWIVQAREFCEKLTEAERRRGAIPKDFHYRLPTEAQWQYACRAGTTQPLYGEEDEIAWPTADAMRAIGHHPVGEKKANAWGFHDMIGNLPELCHDPPGDFSGAAAINPVEPDFVYPVDSSETDPYLVVGSGMDAASREWYLYDETKREDLYTGNHVGFRVALVPDRSIPPDLASIVPEVVERGAQNKWPESAQPVNRIFDNATSNAFPRLRDRAASLKGLIDSAASRAEGKKDAFPLESVVSPDTGHRYLLVDIPLPYHDALEFAETFGGHLATITSQEELDFIAKSFETPARQNAFWIGAEGRSSFKWTTGEKWDFETWGDNQPDRLQAKARRFGIYCAIRDKKGTWGDLDAEESLPMLIEWEK